MDPITFTQMLLRRWFLLVLCGVAGVVFADFVGTSTPPRYQSSVSLQLNPAGRSPFLPYAAPDGTSVGVSPVTSLAASYREVLRSRAFGQVVVQQLQLPVSPDSIGNAINTQLVLNTNILRMTVVWDNPSDAQQLAQRIAEIFIIENQRRQQTQPVTRAHLAELEQSAGELEERLAPLRQQRQRLSDGVARGDLSRLTELTSLEERLAVLESSHANLLVEISRVRASFDTAAILDAATPGAPVDRTPLMQSVVFGLVGGVGVAVALGLLFEYLADAVRTRRQIQAVTGLAPIGQVPHARSAFWRRSRRGAGLVLLNRSASRTTEAFRSLRTSLNQVTPPRPLTAYVVTSASAGEGKTFVACNLAIALAQAGKRVLLVDANMRRPRVHAWFGIDNQVGLADALDRGEHSPDTAIVASGVDKLWLLPAGTPRVSAAELLGTEALGRVVARLQQAWDTIIFDTAPVGEVADTLLIAPHASGSVVVARSGRTRRGALHDALEALFATGRPVLGVVLNDIRSEPLDGFIRHDFEPLSPAASTNAARARTIALHERASG